MKEVALEENLIAYANNLDFKKFKKNYQFFVNEYGITTKCYISLFLQKYKFSESKEEKLEIIDIVKLITENDFTFCDEIIEDLENYNDFGFLYERICPDYQTFITGNTILHTQVKILNIKNIKDLIDNLSNCNITNNYNQNPLDLFLSEHENILECNLKKEIFNILKKNVSYSSFKSKNNPLIKYIEYNIIKEQSPSLSKCDEIIILFNLNKMDILRNYKFISEILKENKICLTFLRDFNNYFKLLL